METKLSQLSWCLFVVGFFSLVGCEMFVPKVGSEGQPCFAETNQCNPGYACIDGVCVSSGGCTDNSDCKTAEKSKCGTKHECEICSTNNDCSHISGNNYCQVDQGCVVCTQNAHCNQGEVCDTESYTCKIDAACTQNSDCTARNESKCNAQGNCEICTQDADCSHITGYKHCHNTKGCVACKQTSDCTNNTICNTTTNTCVDCIDNTRCTNSALSRCSSAGICELCLSDSDCTHIASLGHCQPTLGCVVCTDSSHCNSDEYCNTDNYQCETAPSCSTNADCDQVTASRCVTGECKACLSPADCSHISGMTHCDEGTCGVCAENTDCPTATASKCHTGVCIGCLLDEACNHIFGLNYCYNNVCVACYSDEHCTSGVCNLTTNTCVECRENSDCSNRDASVCTNGYCRSCTDDTGCDHLAPYKWCTSTSTGVYQCELCRENQHCQGDQICDPNQHICAIPCVSDTDCQGPCIDSGVCEGQICTIIPVPSGNSCNGCSSGTCQDGICVNATEDQDGDGYLPIACGGVDCNDYDPNSYLGALSEFGPACSDGIDNDCDQLVDDDDSSCRKEFCSKDLWCWSHPEPQGYALRDICTVETEDFHIAVGDRGTIYQFTSTDFALAPSPTLRNLRSVWCISREEAYAVGNAGTILKFNGYQWSEMSHSLTDNLTGIWGESDGSKTTLVATSDVGAVYRYDSYTNNWKLYEQLETPLYGIWCTSPDKCWVVGGSIADKGAIRYINSGDIEYYDTQPGDVFRDVWASAEGVFVVGDQLGIGRFLVYDFTNWNEKSQGEALFGVWGSGDGLAYAVGNFGQFQWYDGAGNFYTENSGYLFDHFYAISANNSGNLWIVGNTGGRYQRNQGIWTRFGSFLSDHSLRDVMVIGVDGETYAVGDGGLVLRYDAANESWDDKSYGAMATVDLTSIWAFGSDAIWVVGKGKEVWTFDGLQWLKYTSGLPSGTFDLYGVSGNTDGHVWIVGDSGLVLRRDPAGTIKDLTDPSVTSVKLNDVATDGEDAFVVGDNGTLLKCRTTVDNCSLVSTGSVTLSDNINSIAVTQIDGTTHIWVAANSGSVLHFDGNDWFLESVDSGVDLLGIWAADNGQVYAVGPEGRLYRRMDSTWNLQTTNTDRGFNAIHGQSNWLWAVGDWGQIHRYQP